MSEEEREEGKREFEIHRILVALDASLRSLAALEAAAELAAQWHAELLGLFVEDVELLRMASAPAAIRCVYPSASEQPLSAVLIESELRALAERARRSLAGAAERARQIGGRAALHQNDEDEHDAERHVERGEENRNHPAEPKQHDAYSECDTPFHFGRHNGNLLPLSIIDDLGEGLRIEARSANQRAVDLFHRHQPAHVGGLHAAAVENPQAAGGFVAEPRSGERTKEPVRIGGQLRRGPSPGADRPHRFAR